jgi:hypothetical protein
MQTSRCAPSLIGHVLHVSSAEKAIAARSESLSFAQMVRMIPDCTAVTASITATVKCQLSHLNSSFLHLQRVLSDV